MKKRFVSAALAAVMALSMTACGSSNSAAETTAADTEAAESQAEETTAEEAKTTDGGTLIVGFDQDFPPMGFVGDDGEYTGFDLELAQEVAKRLGLEYKAQPIAWDSKDMELESGNIDCIWNGFTMTGREDDYTWTEPYMANQQVFVVANDSDINSQADLAGKIVEVQADSSAEAALKEAPELTATFKELLTTADYNTAFMDLEQGAVDAVAIDIGVAQYQIAQREAGKFVMLQGEDNKLAVEQYAVGFLKGNDELRDTVQKTLDEMAADGTFTQIAEKWGLTDSVCLGK